MKPVVIHILLLTCVFTVWSQTDRLDSLLNEVLGNDKEMMNFINSPSLFCYLYSGISGSSRTFYAGREIGDNMYSISGNVFFFHSKGFFIGTSGLWHSQFDPGYSTTIVTAGINKSLNQKKSIALRSSYNRYFYNSNAETEYNFANSLGTSLSLRNKWIGGRFSFNFLFGKEFGMNVTPSVFSHISVARFGKYNKIRLEPEVSFFIGSEAVEYENTGNLNDNTPGSQSSITVGDDYGLLNTQLYLPVSIDIGDFDLELGYSVNIPTSQNESINYPVNTFLSFSLGYLVPLNKY